MSIPPTIFGRAGGVAVKICGLTRPAEAAACARLGADAIGLVFFERSPRHVTPARAAAITARLPPDTATVGVFVDAGYDRIMSLAAQCRLTTAQLHGNETPELAARLRGRGLRVVKALFDGGDPGLERAGDFEVDAYLVECAGGVLPGGNARRWNWAHAAPLARGFPVIVAGGLTPDNVARAVATARPCGVDVSTGVEAAPGRKDLDAVATFISTATGRRRRDIS